ncbi:g-patch domain-containing protein [Ditylenchus destructor]|nr:g-patch domain-containing protein [Ditylenchus destructor]
MSILAETRKKQRISIDPQNKGWKDDSNKFGQKMLEKHGWKEGSGLGKSQQGITENIKLNPNYNATGLGSEPTNHDKTWIAHHDDFAQILAQLNEGRSTKAANDDESGESQTASIQKQAKKSTRRIHYNRFTRAKDLSLYTKEDKSAVLGNFKNSPKRTNKTNGNQDDQESSNTVVSTLSMKDYFASKSKGMSHSPMENVKKSRKAATADEEVDSDSNERPGFTS